MKSRIVLVWAVLGLLCSGIAFAQDGGLGKKGGGKGGGSDTGKSDPPPQRGGGSGGSGGVKGTPPPQRGGGGSGGGSGGVKNTPPPQRGGGGSGGSGGVKNTPPPQSGNDGLGKKGGGSGGSSGGGQVGRGGGSSGGGQVGRSGGSDVQLGRPERSNGNSGVRNETNTTLGRPQRQSGGADTMFGKQNGISRSGKVQYGDNHNVGTGRVSPSVINNVPVVTTNTRIVREAHRENRVQVIDTRYRSGYNHYDRGWRDDNFCYPYYGFAFYSGCNYVPSPFYYYPHLPGYIDCIRVSFGPFTWTRCETRYNWAPPRYDRYGYDYDRYGDFDYCVSDISRSFESRNLRYLSHLIPTRGRVEIDMGYGDQYALSGDDFYDMMRDLVEGTRTTSYRIRDVYRDGDEATVVADHVFTDPWGRDERVRHTYGLRSVGRGYEICYFRSDRS